MIGTKSSKWHTRNEIVHNLYEKCFFSFVLFSSKETKGEILLIVAMDHENLYYHTALQAVHLTKNKRRDSFL